LSFYDGHTIVLSLDVDLGVRAKNGAHKNLGIAIRPFQRMGGDRISSELSG
jgi:hypothetical protein